SDKAIRAAETDLKVGEIFKWIFYCIAIIAMIAAQNLVVFVFLLCGLTMEVSKRIIKKRIERFKKILDALENGKRELQEISEYTSINETQIRTDIGMMISKKYFNLEGLIELKWLDQNSFKEKNNKMNKVVIISMKEESTVINEENTVYSKNCNNCGANNKITHKAQPCEYCGTILS
ncbi:MAG: hypothetical protein ACK5LC_14765, partial [Coprobacillaceae bacterium]